MKAGIHIGLLILRISSGFLMLFHGIAKIPKGVGSIRNILMEPGWPGWIAYGVYIGEIVAPLMMIIGWRTRLAASVYAVNMIFAILLAHADDLLKVDKSGGWAIELQALYLFAALALVFTGGGKYGISTSRFGD